MSADGKTYTFHLRQGVKFHTTDYFKPTRDFTADDVVFTQAALEHFLSFGEQARVAAKAAKAAEAPATGAR